MAKKAVEKKQESKQGEAKQYAEAYADANDLSVNEAYAHLAVVGWRRLKALKKDNTRREKGLKPQYRKVTVTTIKAKGDPKPVKKSGKAKSKPKAKKPKPAVKADPAAVNGVAAHA